MNWNLVSFRVGFVFLDICYIPFKDGCIRHRKILFFLSDLSQSGETNFSLYRGCDQLRLAEWYYSLLAARDNLFSRIHAAVYFACHYMILSYSELSKGTNWHLNFKNVDFRNISPIQNGNMADSCITPCRSPNRNLSLCYKCNLLMPCIFIFINKDSTHKYLLSFQGLLLPLIPIPMTSPFPVCSISGTPCSLLPKLACAWILSQIFLKVPSFWHTQCVCPH